MALRLRLILCLLASNTCSAYNQTVGLSLAYLEKAVYCGPERFQQWDVGDSISLAPKIEKSMLRFVQSSEESAAGIGRMIEPNGCFVAIRGTFGPISSLLDAVFWLMDFEHDLGCASCQVVAGFYLAYLSIRDQIFHALAQFQCHQRPLYLVGHSQGAAALSYFMFDALMRNYTVQHMYALESPRPGNRRFGEQLRKLLGRTDAWRVTHFQDIVPHLPPSGIFGYEHALPEIYYDSKNGTHYLECGIEDPKCSNHWWPWQLTVGLTLETLSCASIRADHDWYAQIDPCQCGIPQAGATVKVNAIDASDRKNHSDLLENWPRAEHSGVNVDLPSAESLGSPFTPLQWADISTTTSKQRLILVFG